MGCTLPRLHLDPSIAPVRPALVSHKHLCLKRGPPSPRRGETAVEEGGFPVHGLTGWEYGAVLLPS